MSHKDNRYSSRQKASKKHFEKAARQGKPIRTKRNEIQPHTLSRGNRAENATIAEDTMKILDDDADAWTARDSSHTYLNTPDLPPNPNHETEVEIWEGTSTLDACEQLRDVKGLCALNFASAKNPGGGFLKGSLAQEESICRASGLYYCLPDTMYELNKKDHRNYLYHHAAIFSPGVPVIKDNDGNILNERYYASFITCPAINKTHAEPIVGTDVCLMEMKSRIDLILAIAAHQKCKTLVLGNFGCGVFGNNVHDVAKIFHDWLSTKYDGYFEKIVFAVLDDGYSFRYYFG